MITEQMINELTEETCQRRRDMENKLGDRLEERKKTQHKLEHWVLGLARNDQWQELEFSCQIGHWGKWDESEADNKKLEDRLEQLFAEAKSKSQDKYIALIDEGNWLEIEATPWGELELEQTVLILLRNEEWEALELLARKKRLEIEEYEKANAWKTTIDAAIRVATTADWERWNGCPSTDWDFVQWQSYDDMERTFMEWSFGESRDVDPDSEPVECPQLDAICCQMGNDEHLTATIEDCVKAMRLAKAEINAGYEAAGYVRLSERGWRRRE
jgi:hypothetical protein